MISHLRKSGSSQAPFQPLKALSTSACQRARRCAQIAGLVGLARLLDGGDAHVLGEEMRRDQHQAADAVILMAAGIDRGDGSAVAVADQQSALEADGVEQSRQRFARLVVHVGERARQRDRARFPVTGARIDENAAAGRGLQLVGKIAPQTDAAEAFVQQHQRRRRSGRGPIMRYSRCLEPMSRKPESRERHYLAPGPSARNLKRWILPVAVFGSSVRNSIQRGYLYGASLALTCSCSARISASLALSGSLSTT